MLKAKCDNHKKSAQAYFFTTETNFNERSSVFFRVMNIPSLLKGNLHNEAKVRVEFVNCICQNIYLNHRACGHSVTSQKHSPKISWLPRW